VDIGANLTNKKFHRDLGAVVQRAKEAGKTPHSYIPWLLHVVPF